ncbi:vacuolar protein sorting-associated protein 28 homolog 2 [Tanacetum coccineum]|uniref:Vacuolar protein sorting-associated protein 28 homolog 2 n=1 Tax=Tanacetum coccineum TaxID=301880 RepID=A0ABQ4WZD5_9ASTR
MGRIDNSRALQQNGKDKVVISKALISSPSSKATWKMGKHNGMIGFTLESLTEQTQMPHNGLPRWQSVRRGQQGKCLLHLFIPSHCCSVILVFNCSISNWRFVWFSNIASDWFISVSITKSTPWKSSYGMTNVREKLEKAYVRDIILAADYEMECQKLIAHFKTLSSTLRDTLPSIERFHDTYNMDCPAAINRLVISSVPAIVEHRAAAAAFGLTSAATVAECLSILPPDFEGMTKMKEWIGRLSKMGVADELTEQQARQLHFDLESSYDSFRAALPTAGT